MNCIFKFQGIKTVSDVGVQSNPRTHKAETGGLQV